MNGGCWQMRLEKVGYRVYCEGSECCEPMLSLSNTLVSLRALCMNIESELKLTQIEKRIYWLMQ